MKKSLVITLALVFVLGIAGTAFAAANPFVDVPAKHWAYDAVSKLAQAGVVDGYGDGTFRGDKTITRYEMAQIVAKAMTRSDKQNAETKALVDKLAVEFNAELQNLGVRVSKLEKNASTIKFTGDARIRFQKPEDGDSTFYQRFRVNMTAAVNENTAFTGRFVGMSHNEAGLTTADKAQTGIAAFTTKNAFNTGATTTVGRYGEILGQTGYLMDTTGYGLVDGVKATVGNELKITLGYADFAAYAAGLGEALYAEAKYNTSKATNLSASYLGSKESVNEVNVIAAGFTTKMGKDWALTGEYFKNTDATDDPSAYLARISYKGASAAQPQSWGLAAEYRNFELDATPALFSGANVAVSDVKGFALIGNYTLAKNIVLEGFQTFNSKVESTGLDALERTRIQVNFSF